MSAKYADFADKHLHVTLKSGSELMVSCPFHQASHSTMQFNIDRGLFICFSCGESGNIKKLARHLGVVNYREATPDIEDVMEKLDALRKDERKEPKPLSEETLARFNFPNRYWLSRGFTDSTIQAFDLGYEPLRNAATIPARNPRGELVGVIYRYLDEDVTLRYKYPKRFSRSRNMHGYWLADNDDSDLVVITEGAVDAMKVWQAGYPALAQYGSTLSVQQVRLLRRLGVGQIVLFYDDDDTGHKATLWAQGVRFRKHKTRFGTKVTKKEYEPATDLRREFLVYAVRYRSGWKSDPGEMNNRAIQAAVESAEQVI